MYFQFDCTSTLITRPIWLYFCFDCTSALIILVIKLYFQFNCASTLIALPITLVLLVEDMPSIFILYRLLIIYYSQATDITTSNIKT
jgi:hypothetical protein